MHPLLWILFSGVLVVAHGPESYAALNARVALLWIAAEESYLDVINGVEQKPFPTIEGLRNIQRLMKIRNPAIENFKLEEMIDDRILRRLDESGFIDGPGENLTGEIGLPKKTPLQR